MKKIDIEFVRRAVRVLATGVALDDKRQVRAATEALAREAGVKMPS